MAELTFADKPTLHGELVTLRPVAVADVPALATISAESLRLTGTHATFTAETQIDWYATRADHADRIDLSIIERATGAWAGEVVLNELDPANQSCGFRIILANESFYGRGLGTEATSLVLAHAFDTVGVNRIELEAYSFNPRARHVYEKAGFVLEGTERQALNWRGEWIDAHLMAMLASDWRNRPSRAPADEAEETGDIR